MFLLGGRSVCDFTRNVHKCFISKPMGRCATLLVIICFCYCHHGRRISTYMHPPPPISPSLWNPVLAVRKQLNRVRVCYPRYGYVTILYDSFRDCGFNSPSMKQPTGSPIIQIKPISFFFSSCGNSRSFYGRKLTFHDTERIFIYKNFKRNNIDVDFVNSSRSFCDNINYEWFLVDYILA